MRRFDAARDVIYVALDEWLAFIMEPHDRLSQPDLVDRFVVIKPQVRHIAVPEALLRDEADMLRPLFLYFFNMESLYVVVDPQPRLPPAETGSEQQTTCWEIESIRGGKLRWNPLNISFDRTELDKTGDTSGALHKRIELVSAELRDELIGYNVDTFKIETVIAVRP
ncbi:hypothetical protein BX600DRAFT_471233 [Xylariales sp. PMI_506]|nr:hypothetical protein BX600DRAFT_471233 [Xylariales sp. PMI_506]